MTTKSSATKKRVFSRRMFGTSANWKKNILNSVKEVTWKLKILPTLGGYSKNRQKCKKNSIELKTGEKNWPKYWSFSENRHIFDPKNWCFHGVVSALRVFQKSTIQRKYSIEKEKNQKNWTRSTKPHDY